jgi:hypothetical protein
LALLHYVHLDVLWMLDRFERVPFMPGLSSAFPAVPFALAFRCWFVQTITGGWLATVAAVLGYPIFQCLNSSRQLAYRSVK